MEDKIKYLKAERERLRKCRIGRIGDKHVQVNLKECNKLSVKIERLERFKEKTSRNNKANVEVKG